MLELQDTIVAIRKGGDKLVVGNLESGKYPTIEFSTDPSQVCRGRHIYSSAANSVISTWVQTAALPSRCQAGDRGGASATAGIRQWLAAAACLTEGQSKSESDA